MSTTHAEERTNLQARIQSNSVKLKSKMIVTAWRQMMKSTIPIIVNQDMPSTLHKYTLPPPTQFRAPLFHGTWQRNKGRLRFKHSYQLSCMSMPTKAEEERALSLLRLLHYKEFTLQTLLDILAQKDLIDVLFDIDALFDNGVDANVDVRTLVKYLKGL